MRGEGQKRGFGWLLRWRKGRDFWRRVRWVGIRKKVEGRVERIMWLKMEVQMSQMGLLLR